VRELLLRLEYKRRGYRDRVRAHFTDGDRRFSAFALLVLLFSVSQPVMIPWYLGEAGGLALIGLMLAFTLILAPIALLLL
jgi:hypothetical protein